MDRRDPKGKEEPVSDLVVEEFGVVITKSDGSQETVYEGRSRFNAMATARVYRKLLVEEGWPIEVCAPGLPETISTRDCREAFLEENPWLRWRRPH